MGGWRASETATSPKPRWWEALRTPRGLFLASALLLCVLPLTKDIRDPDFWWHLRAGQLILARHGLIGTDPFTYTAAGHHWTMHEWLTEVLFAALHAVGGLAAVVVTLSLLSWAGFVVLFAAARLRRPHHLALGLGIVLAAIVGAPVWGPRAQMITFTFSCVLLFLVERHLRRGGRAIWATVPLFLLWSNLHSGFIVGVGFLLLVLVAEWLGARLGLDVAPADRRRTLALVLLVSTAVVVLNPNGPQIYLYPFETQGSGAQQSLIQEWHSPDFHDASTWAFEAMLLGLVAMLTATRRLRPRDLALTLATTALALQSERHIALFVAAVTPIWIEQADACGRRLAAWWHSRPRRTAPAARRQSPSRDATAGGPTTARPPRGSALVAVVCLGALGLLATARLAEAASTREDSLSYAEDYPVCAARWLLQSPGGLRIFNQYGEGGFLALRLSAHGDRVFIFGDAALMGDALLREYGAVVAVTPEFERILRDSRTDLVLFDVGTALADVLAQSPRWIEVYRDPRSVAFVPATAAGRALAAELAATPVWTGPDPCAELARHGPSGGGS